MWLKTLSVVALSVALAQIQNVRSEKFKVIREWKYLNFTWPGEEVYRTAISNGLYIPENNIVSGIKHFEDHFYLTLPRMKNGVPATLARISSGTTKDTSPALEPFPSWAMNNIGDCNALQNVQNIEIDPKGQAWIIDSGRTETLNNVPTMRCQPKLIIFDIKKNMTTTAYTFPDSVASFNSNFLYDIVVDDTDGGYAYITDNSAKNPGIIVFSVKDHHSWKIRHSQSMKADPSSSTFHVNQILIQAPINIASIALGPRVHMAGDRVILNEDRDVFYSPLSSLHLYSLNTSVLRNEMYGTGEYQGDVIDYGLKGSQSVGMIMDNQGILYFSLLSTNSIAKWDIRTPFQSGQSIIARDQRYLEWPNSFTFDQDGNLTVLVNRLDKFIYEKLNLSEANFRLITARVGGRSYLYDQTYDYETEKNNDSMTTHSGRLPEPNDLLPSDQAPQPAYDYGHRSTVEPEPTAEPTAEPTPEPTGSHMDHDHMSHDHMNHDHMNHDQTDPMKSNSTSSGQSSQEKTDSSASKVVGTFLGVLFAGALFLA